MQALLMSTAPAAKRSNTSKRHELIKRKVNEYRAACKSKTGFAPDLDEVIQEVANDFGYSVVTVKKILKK